MGQHRKAPRHAATAAARPEVPAPARAGRHVAADARGRRRPALAVLGASAAVLAGVAVSLPGHAAGPLAVADSTTIENGDSWSPEPLVLGASPVAGSLPARRLAAVSVTKVGAAPTAAVAVPGIPPAALAAYQTAAGRTPGCHLPWNVLAGIGAVESGHAHGHGAEDPAWDGVARPRILGPVLNGAPFAAVPDSDGGLLDGDPVWDRAVGPMQFLPSTWQRYGVDANHDGTADPQDIRDAAAAAADYLCAAGGDLATSVGLATAVFAYNHSSDYVRNVLATAMRYGPVPVGPTVLDTLPPGTLPPDASPAGPPTTGGAAQAAAQGGPAPEPAPDPAPVPAPPGPPPASASSPPAQPGGGGAPASPASPSPAGSGPAGSGPASPSPASPSPAGADPGSASPTASAAPGSSGPGSPSASAP